MKLVEEYKFFHSLIQMYERDRNHYLIFVYSEISHLLNIRIAFLSFFDTQFNSLLLNENEDKVHPDIFPH
jgi:hypothetical protein